MKKIILGILIGVGLTGTVFASHAAWTQTLADSPLVSRIGWADNDRITTEVHRFEWYGDVCYAAISSDSSLSPGISCVKH